MQRSNRPFMYSVVALALLSSGLPAGADLRLRVVPPSQGLSVSPGSQSDFVADEATPTSIVGGLSGLASASLSDTDSSQRVFQFSATGFDRGGSAVAATAPDPAQLGPITFQIVGTASEAGPVVLEITATMSQSNEMYAAAVHSISINGSPQSLGNHSGGYCARLEVGDTFEYSAGASAFGTADTSHWAEMTSTLRVFLPPFTLTNLVRALNVAAGRVEATAKDLVCLDVETGPEARIDMNDVVRLARKLAQLDPNP